MRKSVNLTRMLLLSIAFMLLFTAFTTACAYSAKLNSTKDFMEYMDDKDVRYTFLGQSEDSDYERVKVSYSGDNMEGISVTFIFNEDEEDAAARCWNIATVSQENLSEAYELINQKNLDYRWVKFALDTRDNTIQAEVDIAFRARDVGPICFEILSHIVSIVDDCYPDFKKLEG